MSSTIQGSANHVFRLTALWALSESGLGGFMHAMKIPFTGIVCGGFAVMIICLLASFSERPFKTIIQSTLLVIAIKAAVSPHSPPAAYLAVAFQGFLGAFMAGLSRGNKIMVVLFSVLAMLESALQKIITMTIIMGKDLWLAFDSFAGDVLKIFHMDPQNSFSLWAIGIYCGIYLFWGIILGWYTAILPSRLHKIDEAEIQRLLAFSKAYRNRVVVRQKGKKTKKITGYLSLLIFVGATFIIQSPALGWQKALYLVLRSLAIVLFYLYALSPLFRFFIRKWSLRQQKNNTNTFKEIIDILPSMNTLLLPAWTDAGNSSGKIGRYLRFPLNLLLLSLYHTDGEDHTILPGDTQWENH